MTVDLLTFSLAGVDLAVAVAGPAGNIDKTTTPPVRA